MPAWGINTLAYMRILSDHGNLQRNYPFILGKTLMRLKNIYRSRIKGIVIPSGSPKVKFLLKITEINSSNAVSRWVQVSLLESQLFLGELPAD